MRYAPITDRLHGLGGAKWEIHRLARQMMAAGQDVIALTIGEPDVPCPAGLIDVADRAMRAGRTGYSNGHGEAAAAGCDAVAFSPAPPQPARASDSATASTARG